MNQMPGSRRLTHRQTAATAYEAMCAAARAVGWVSGMIGDDQDLVGKRDPQQPDVPDPQLGQALERRSGQRDHQQHRDGDVYGQHGAPSSVTGMVDSARPTRVRISAAGIGRANR